jgi:hypothetical protein
VLLLQNCCYLPQLFLGQGLHTINSVCYKSTIKHCNSIQTIALKPAITPLIGNKLFKIHKQLSNLCLCLLKPVHIQHVSAPKKCHPPCFAALSDSWSTILWLLTKASVYHSTTAVLSFCHAHICSTTFHLVHKSDVIIFCVVVLWFIQTWVLYVEGCSQLSLWYINVIKYWAYLKRQRQK